MKVQGLLAVTFILFAFADAKIDHCSDETPGPVPSCNKCDSGYGLFPNTKDQDTWNTCVSCKDPKYIPS